jgi:hypothetical protein
MSLVVGLLVPWQHFYSADTFNGSHSILSLNEYVSDLVGES